MVPLIQQWLSHHGKVEGNLAVVQALGQCQTSTGVLEHSGELLVGLRSTLESQDLTQAEEHWASRLGAKASFFHVL